MDFSNFKTYNLVSGLATISITKNGMTFSKNALIRLGKPDYLRILINEEDKQIVFQICDKDEEGSVKCLANRNKTDNLSYKINNRDFLSKMAVLLGCSPENLNYKMVGEFFEDDKIMMLDLNKAEKTADSDLSKEEKTADSDLNKEEETVDTDSNTAEETTDMEEE